MFIANSTGEVVVQRDNVNAVLVQGLLIVFKMGRGPDIVYEEASDEDELATLTARTWGQLSDE